MTEWQLQAAATAALVAYLVLGLLACRWVHIVYTRLTDRALAIVNGQAERGNDGIRAGDGRKLLSVVSYEVRAGSDGAWIESRRMTEAKTWRCYHRELVDG